jgi:hypothetical protein
MISFKKQRLREDETNVLFQKMQLFLFDTLVLVLVLKEVLPVDVVD